jgi:hypothetical protein
VGDPWFQLTIYSALYEKFSARAEFHPGFPGYIKLEISAPDEFQPGLKKQRLFKVIHQ